MPGSIRKPEVVQQFRCQATFASNFEPRPVEVATRLTVVQIANALTAVAGMTAAISTGHYQKCRLSRLLQVSPESVNSIRKPPYPVMPFSGSRGSPAPALAGACSLYATRCFTAYTVATGKPGRVLIALWKLACCRPRPARSQPADRGKACCSHDKDVPTADVPVVLQSSASGSTRRG